MKNVDSTGESSVCSLVPRELSATKLSEKVWKGKNVSTNYALVPESAELCRQEEVTFYARLCALLIVSFPTVWLLYVLILSYYLQTSGTDGQPTPFLWRALPVSINGVYLARIVSRVGSLPYCARKFHCTWIFYFVSMRARTPTELFPVTFILLRQFCVTWKTKELYKLSCHMLETICYYLV
ncbi:hypothetical protein AVEN_49666-1 [Araneus ventricosus]|uniref:Uncharacterized protein n=1 Tax=Araneus ventricosus TaxID=182803 RepID=A0A4Y2JPS8_ARAVE|nr:hypothetical protein AVEN_49666-1 [Araneus ventricosus]